MKCPLLKTYETLAYIDSRRRYTFSESIGFSEALKDCIEKECMAWSKERQTCNYFNPDNKRMVEFSL